ncbi:MAG: kelch repeat-containing protein [Deltaproteobacteria bacterium]|jgi:hypothetical protein
MNTRTALLLLPVLTFACSGGDDGSDDTNIPPRDGGTTSSIRDGGVVEDGCPDLGPALSGAEVAPLRRGDMAAAYDDKCGVVYMAFGDKSEPEMCSFAGSDFIDDLHAFDVDAGTWHTLSTVSTEAPRQRARSQAVWDAQNDRFVLFGGRWRPGSSGEYTFLNDVWAFNPVDRSWAELSAQRGGLFNDAPPNGVPKGRMNFSMVADPNSSAVFIHAGGQTNPAFSQFYPDSQTWVFNVSTNDWTMVPVSSTPPARLFHSSAYDAERQRLYVFAGAGEDAFVSFGDGNMWVLDLTTLAWSEIDQGPLGNGYDANRPRPRIKGKMITDQVRDRILLFGGHDDLGLGNNNDLWAFDLDTQTWSLVDEGDAPGRTNSVAFCEFYGNFAAANPAVPERRESHLFVKAGDDRVVLYGGRTDCGLANDTWILDLTSDTWTQVTVSPTGMTCVRNGNPNCDDDSARMCD